MAFIEYIDKKRKQDFIVVIAVIIVCAVIVLVTVFKAFSFAQSERKKIYVLNQDMVLTASLTGNDVTLDIEAKAHINLFHQLFFTLPPDDEYMKYTLEKAMYLIDESGLVQKNTLQEKGFYNNILSASANFSIIADSINFNSKTMKFIYYGKQRIERKTTILYRQLITEGVITKSKRTENNPHGLTITNYRTILNKDLETKEKTDY